LLPAAPDRPNPSYAPWFNVPLKSARVAVSVINMLQQQSRASRLSFADVVKKLAEEPEDSGIFISKKVRCDNSSTNLICRKNASSAHLLPAWQDPLMSLLASITGATAAFWSVVELWRALLRLCPNLVCISRTCRL